jgi:hypothetical protein
MSSAEKFRELNPLEFTADQVRKKLWTAIASKPPRRIGGHTQLSLAAAIGISAQYLNDILHGHREPCEKCLQYLGLEKVVVYRIPVRKS